MDIRWKAEYPACALSNFAPHAFEFDGVACASMEGLLQSFKFDKWRSQKRVCKLVGIEAKRRGGKRDGAWKAVQKLWWRRRPYDRHGPEYQELLDRAFAALSNNNSFCRALLATGYVALTHSIGSADPSETVLTEQEFCSRLAEIRTRLQQGA